MNLLFDQNISFRAVRQLNSLFPNAKSVRELGLENSNDRKIWNFAKENNYTIITFDSDFYDLMALFGHPPRIIWLRLGNTSTVNLVKTFTMHFEIIKSFLTDQNYLEVGCLEIDN